MSTDLQSLRQSVHSVLDLPRPAQQVVDNYLHLKLGGTEVACPYHINPRLRIRSRALLGKGSPEEIKAFAAAYFKNQAMHIAGDPARLRSFLQACGLGIDCSGFAAWVLNALTRTTLNRPIWKCLKFPGLRGNVVSKMRPIENISARLLTGAVNAQTVTDLTQVRPGDLIRAANAHHVLIIIEVGLDRHDNATYFQYAQSSCMYGAESGVRTGHAVIKKPRGSLLEQQWFDNYKESIIEELIAEGGDDSKIVRLKSLSQSPATAASFRNSES